MKQGAQPSKVQISRLAPSARRAFRALHTYANMRFLAACCLAALGARASAMGTRPTSVDLDERLTAVEAKVTSYCSFPMCGCTCDVETPGMCGHESDAKGAVDGLVASHGGCAGARATLGLGNAGECQNAGPLLAGIVAELYKIPADSLSLSCRVDTAHYTCTCRTPGQGTIDYNGFDCTNGNNAWCHSDQQCYNTQPWPMGTGNFFVGAYGCMPCNGEWAANDPSRGRCKPTTHLAAAPPSWAPIYYRPCGGPSGSCGGGLPTIG